MKVGIFDSGSGGLAIFKSILEVSPHYHYVYLGDHLHNPYGNLDFETTLLYTQRSVDYLFSEGCQIIIIACNTSSARVLRTLQQNYLPQFQSKDKRILGVVRPATEIISQLKTKDWVAIWGTEGTISSKSYEIEITNYNPHLNIVSQSCPSLAQLIEKNDSGPILEKIQQYWKETLYKVNHQKISTLLLACTHYPLIIEKIQTIIDPKIEILDQRFFIGEKWLQYLQKHPTLEKKLSAQHKIEFKTTQQQSYFYNITQKLFQSPLTIQTVKIK